MLSVLSWHFFFIFYSWALETTMLLKVFLTPSGTLQCQHAFRSTLYSMLLLLLLSKNHFLLLYNAITEVSPVLFFAHFLYSMSLNRTCSDFFLFFNTVIAVVTDPFPMWVFSHWITYIISSKMVSQLPLHSVKFILILWMYNIGRWLKIFTHLLKMTFMLPKIIYVYIQACVALTGWKHSNAL